jgi:hypothetical protein
MIQPRQLPRPDAGGGIPPLAVAILVATVFACSVYANLSFTVTDPADYRYLPPFLAGVNANQNDHLGAEYFNIGRSLARGEGFSHPFGRPTGPTAWMPPVLPVLLAGLLRLCGGNRDVVMLVVVFLQVFVLVATGLLVLALARQSSGRAGPWAALAVYLVALVWDFHSWFQLTHDSWLVLLALDLLLAWFCWGRPLGRWRTAAGWGLFGGLCAQVNPLVGLTWGVVALAAGRHRRDWPRLAAALLAAAVVLAPWTVRNYLVLGRLIPVKSNAAYELYQSQCLQADGLIHRRTFGRHPGHPDSREGKEYDRLGESAYLEHKREQFWQAVRADPTDFLDRAANRLLGVTLWYEPFDREAGRRWVLWVSRLLHPLPFLGLLFLVGTGLWLRLTQTQWTVMSVYLLYLLPYAGASYYERYGLPLLGIKVLLVFWAAGRVLRLTRSEEPPTPRPGTAVSRRGPRPAAAAPAAPAPGR